jgi:hypothetical protein
MIITDSFVFLHLPKTGGTFVSKMLLELGQRVEGFEAFEAFEAVVSKHAGAARIPAEHKDKPRLICVRNVFEHYVSRYFFKWWKDPARVDKIYLMDLVRKDYPHFPDLSFAEYLRFANTWGYRRKIARPKRLAEFDRLAVGFNSFELCRIALPRPGHFLVTADSCPDEDVRRTFERVHFLRTEDLNRSLYEYLLGLGHKSAQLQFILESGIVLPKFGGRAETDTWRSYYDQESIDYVTQRDRLYFRLFPEMRAKVEA